MPYSYCVSIILLCSLKCICFYSVHIAQSQLSGTLCGRFCCMSSASTVLFCLERYSASLLCLWYLSSVLHYLFLLLYKLKILLSGSGVRSNYPDPGSGRIIRIRGPVKPGRIFNLGIRIPAFFFCLYYIVRPSNFNDPPRCRQHLTVLKAGFRIRIRIDPH